MQIHCIANFNFFRIYLSLFDRKEHKLYKEHIVHCFPLIDRSCLFISFREQGNYQFGFGIHRIFSLLLSRDYCQKVNISSTLNPKSFLLAADGKCVPYIVFDCLKFVTLGRQRTQDDLDNPTRSQLSRSLIVTKCKAHPKQNALWPNPGCCMFAQSGWFQKEKLFSKRERGLNS